MPAVDERVVHWLLRESIRRPRLVLGTWLSVLVGLLAPALGVSVNTSNDNVLDRSDPALVFYPESVETFGGDEVVVVAVEGGSPLDSTLAGRIVELSDQLDQIEGVSRVDSLSTVPLVRFSEGLLEFVPGITGGSQDLAEARERLARDLVARDSLISRDLRVGAVNVRLEDSLGA